MSDLDKYDSISERLPDDCDFSQRLEKFSKIVKGLNSNGIELLETSNGNPVVGDSSGWKLTHNIITWHVFRVEDVVDMILNNRKNSVTSSNS